MIPKPRRCKHCDLVFYPRIFKKKSKRKQDKCPNCHNPWNKKRKYSGKSVRYHIEEVN